MTASVEEAARAALYAKLGAVATASGAFSVVGRLKGYAVVIPASGVGAHQIDEAAVMITAALGDGEQEAELALPCRIALVTALDQADAETALDEAAEAIRVALRADRTLGGACEYLELGPKVPAKTTPISAVPEHRGLGFTVRLLVTDLI